MERRRELDILEKHLAIKKQEFKEKLDTLREQKKCVLEKDIALKERMIKCDKFIQDCEIRKERAITIAQEEMDQLKVKDGELLELRSQLKDLQKHRDVVQLQQKQSTIHVLLEKVLDASNGELKQAKDVVLKHELLKNVSEALWKSQEDAQHFIKYKKSDIFRFIKDKNEEMMKIKLQIALLKDQVAQINKEVKDLETDWEMSIANESSQQLQCERMKLSIFNMAQILSKHCKRQMRSESPVEQLILVQQYIEDLKFICVEISKSERSDSGLAQATSSVGKMSLAGKKRNN